MIPSLPSARLTLWAAVLGATVALPLAGCGDDPADPDGSDGALWTEVPLPPTGDDLTLLAIAARGPQAMVLGFQGSPTGVGGRSGAKDGSGSSVLFELQADGSWDLYPRPGGSATAVWWGLALAEDGQPVLAGFETAGGQSGGCVLDTRGGQTLQHCYPSLGLQAIDADANVMTAGGTSTGGELWTSRDPQVWTVDPIPLSGVNETGLVDVDMRGDLTVVCGFDDGADVPQVLLMREGTADWQFVDLGGIATFGRTFEAAALTADGAIFLGGIAGAGGLSPVAFLSVRSAAGDWAEIELPNPTRLGRVNDILIAADGTVYLACSGEADIPTAHIVHSSQSGAVEELLPFPGELVALAQTEDGTVWAVGTRIGCGGGVAQEGMRKAWSRGFIDHQTISVIICLINLLLNNSLGISKFVLETPGDH